MIFVKGATLVLIIFLSFFLTTSSFAQSKIFFSEIELKQHNFTSYENINSNQLIYPFKKYWENITLKLTFGNQNRQNYTWILYQKRFKELVFIINNDKTGFLPDTADRYNTFAGRTKTLVSLTSNQKKQIKDNISLLEKLRDRYHSGSAYWIKIQETVDTTKSLI